MALELAVTCATRTGNDMALHFDYAPGQLEAHFSHDSQFDYINLDIRLGGDVTWITESDCAFQRSWTPVSG